VNSEITKMYDECEVRGWVFYDAACPWCRGLARRLAPVLRPQHVEFAPLQASWPRARFGGTEEEWRREMRFQLADGRCYGGADAVLEIASFIAWARPWLLLTRLPGVRPLLRAAYARVAALRPCANGSCPARPIAQAGWPGRTARSWAIWTGLTAVVVFASSPLPAWGQMWLWAGWLFVGAKALVWGRAREAQRLASRWRRLGFWLAWPGMDAPAFLRSDPAGAARAWRKPTAANWAFAAAKGAFGAALVWGGARGALTWSPWGAGWVGLVGLGFLLHFGLFHLLALAWRRQGVDAEPIMAAPILSRSLREFWGRRWNLAFHRLSHDFLLVPLRSKLGRAGAVAMVFLISGLVHELVISVPARGGYGGPSFYFGLQAAGLLLESSSWGRRVGLGRGRVGWCFMALVTAVPAGLLFHRPFVERVILPFLKALGAF